MFKGWNFETYNNAFTKQVFPVRNHQVTLGLNIHHPSFPEGEIMLISHMEAAKELVGITADTGSYADISVMVTSGFRADMTTRRTFIPFEIAIDEILPGIMILGLMLP